jgi:hypothetical protein
MATIVVMGFVGRESGAQSVAPVTARDSTDVVLAAATRAAQDMLRPGIQHFLLPTVAGGSSRWGSAIFQQLIVAFGARPADDVAQVPAASEIVRIGGIRQEADSIFVSVEVERTGDRGLITFGKEYIIERVRGGWAVKGVRFISSS